MKISALDFDIKRTWCIHIPILIHEYGWSVQQKNKTFPLCGVVNISQNDEEWLQCYSLVFFLNKKKNDINKTSHSNMTLCSSFWW